MLKLWNYQTVHTDYTFTHLMEVLTQRKSTSLESKDTERTSFIDERHEETIERECERCQYENSIDVRLRSISSIFNVPFRIEVETDSEIV